MYTRDTFRSVLQNVSKIVVKAGCFAGHAGGKQTENGSFANHLAEKRPPGNIQLEFTNFVFFPRGGLWYISTPKHV